jgi:hypothetical protein
VTTHLIAVLLTQGARPCAHATIQAASDTALEVTGHTPTGIRFAGYDHTHTPADAPTGARCALYEVDLPNLT